MPLKLNYLFASEKLVFPLKVAFDKKDTSVTIIDNNGIY